jgi:hypothetical protein
VSGPAQQFPFVARDPALGSASLAPMLPITLKPAQTVAAPPIAVSALLDTGAAVNVLPYSIGTQLGFLWDRQTTSVQLSGNLASVEARVVLVSATVAQFPIVRLAFAWAKQDSIPVILGQVNFFMEFDVCFFRSRAFFDIRARS